MTPFISRPRKRAPKAITYRTTTISSHLHLPTPYKHCKNGQTYPKETHRGDKFELEEDGDSGHGGGPTAANTNPVAHWKKEYDLEKHFNCTESPDLGCVENYWQAPQAYVQKQLHYNRQTLMKLVIEGWDKVSQPFISKQVHSMPR